jgi:hypothetical protein
MSTHSPKLEDRSLLAIRDLFNICATYGCVMASFPDLTLRAFMAFLTLRTNSGVIQFRKSLRSPRFIGFSKGMLII